MVTEDAPENLSAFVPSSIEDVEQIIKKKGVIQFREPVLEAPKKIVN